MTTLKEGDKAPDITATGAPSLATFKGKKVVLYFYPKDDTPGCTAESCNLRDNYAALKAKGFEIIGVSPDDHASHEKFASKYSLPFLLVADTDKTVANAYGVWGEKNMYGKISMGILRTTFVIDENGNIEKIFKKVDTQDHTQQILTALGY